MSQDGAGASYNTGSSSYCLDCAEAAAEGKLKPAFNASYQAACANDKAGKCEFIDANLFKVTPSLFSYSFLFALNELSLSLSLSSSSSLFALN